MLSLAVLAGPWPRVGVVAAALFAASAMLARTDESRAWSMLGALVLAPVLLLDDVWHSPQLSVLHHHPLEAAIGAAVVLATLAAAAYGVHRIPWVVAPLTAGQGKFNGINVYGQVQGTQNIYRINALTGDPNHLGPWKAARNLSPSPSGRGPG